MCELPPGNIEIRKKDRRNVLWLTDAIYNVLRIYAQDLETSMTDVGNRIILGHLTEAYGYKSPSQLHREAFKLIFPNSPPFRMRLGHYYIARNRSAGRFQSSEVCFADGYDHKRARINHNSWP